MLFSYFKKLECFRSFEIMAFKPKTFAKFFFTNWLSFVGNRTVLVHHVNLSHSFTDILLLPFWGVFSCPSNTFLFVTKNL